MSRMAFKQSCTANIRQNSPIVKWFGCLLVASLVGAALPVGGVARPHQVKKKDIQSGDAGKGAAPVSDDASAVEALITTDMGVIHFAFYPEQAPKHVQHFIKLAREGFYDGSAFHRVFAHGLIQGGDPLLKNPKTPRDKWGTGALNQLPDEFSDLRHVRGTVSTVRLPGKSGSDGAQFFICASPQTQLDGQYSAFGVVTDGIETVDRISAVPADDQHNTVNPVKIVSIKIVPKPVEPFKDASIDQLRRDVLLKTSMGDITLEMNPDVAPETVRNFLKLVETGWYDHTAFQRIIPGFVIQGGAGRTRSTDVHHPADKWVRNLNPEFSKLNHVRGVLSMARGAAVDSADTSFFIMLGTASHLDGNYTIFGKVIDGFETMDRIEKVERSGETPLERIELIEAVIKP